jgi:hypothetical protein
VRQTISERAMRNVVRVRLQPFDSPCEEVERRLRGEAGREEGLEHAVPRDGVDEPGRVADDGSASTCEGRAWRAKREAVAPDAFQVVGRHAVRRAESPQSLAKARSLPLPAAEPDVRVVALREDPAVAPGDEPELEHRTASVAVAEPVVGDVALECHADRLVAAEPERPGAHAVDAVGADHRPRQQPFPAGDDLGAVRPRRDRRDLHAVAELGSGCDRPLDQVGVQPDALRHQDERRTIATLDPGPVPQPHPHGRDRVLHDRVDREREQPSGAPRHAPAAGLVAREACPVEQQDRGTRQGQPVRARRARGPGAHDDGVVTRHGGIIAAGSHRSPSPLV